MKTNNEKETNIFQEKYYLSKEEKLNYEGLKYKTSPIEKVFPLRKSFIQKGPLLKQLTETRVRKFSVETSESKTFYPFIDYDIKFVEKFDELNKSLSDISDYVLEKEEKNNSENSFCSSDENNNEDIECEIVRNKSKKNSIFSSNYYNNIDNNGLVDNEWDNEMDQITKEIIFSQKKK